MIENRRPASRFGSWPSLLDLTEALRSWQIAVLFSMFCLWQGSTGIHPDGSSFVVNYTVNMSWELE
jgi:hypothetical protein